ncbi:TrbI/VirB10 family protein [Erythrobacter insulae]|uniref:TrbI/VirB10 family protein n=1 Tax=Erythrobacter insulae TaxID=2584124 RepID=A0A547PDB7_9SPHN|nr:TrbI/VirB10 family protein [Erythrobacter insulae]TRD12132.1 TrbI/VirB10 family protein [Erythrobacter insulae]
MASAEQADQPSAPNDIRPVVPTGPSGRWELWLFIPLLLIGGYWLFTALGSGREDAAHSGIAAATQQPGNTRISSSAPLQVPDRFSGLEREAPRTPAEPEQASQTAAPNYPPPPIGPSQQRQFPSQPFVQPLPPPPTRAAPPPVARVVYDGGTNASQTGTINVGGNRVQAGRLEKPSYTIPQGTVIPAVLETALDSTRPGGARALVQRDISGFDGTRVLIPRGSRLYGEYKAGLRPGQKRTLVEWGRLIRPDGVTIQLDSPSSDPLGRAGVRGKVDSKFFQRFGNALLQSVFDIGTGIAVSEASNGVVVALPGSTQNVQISEEQQPLPTLKVKQGTSVSVFVSRDLDFSTVEP